MPIGGNNAEPQKKASNKKRRPNNKTKSKQRTTEKPRVKTSKKNASNSNSSDFNKLTPANVSSLRWDNVLTDTTLENDRIEQYKELRRQRYGEARQQAIQTLIEQMKQTSLNATKT